MANINFDSLVIDRVVDATMESSAGDIRYLLNNLSNVSINTTAESRDKVDAQGVLIKRFFTAKTIEVSGECNVWSLSLSAEQAGSEKILATADAKLTAPKFLFLDAAEGEHTLALKPVAPITKMYAVNANGTLGEVFTSDVAADTTHFKYEETESGAKLTFPSGVTGRLFVKYDYETENGVKVVSKADEFPKTGQLTFRVAVADTCSVDTVRLAYIVFPSFQMSPDCELTLDTESTQSFSGAAQVDYCSSSKDMYYIIMSEDDEM